ncbi:MAG: histidine kinase [Microbacteriaceae bacterium]|jgi:signal transduction histidine kinase|nr:histidine kinase [Microbacteriaceae bacterium]
MVVMAAKTVMSPPAPLARQSHNPISRPQIETIVSRSVGVFGVLFAAQAVPAVLTQLPQEQPNWIPVFVLAIFGGILATLVASIAKRFVRVVYGYLSFAYLVALIAWPLLAKNPHAVADQRPWLWLLCTVATSTAAVAFSPWRATAYLIVTPIVYGMVRATPSGGGAALGPVILDVLYATLLGGAVLILITLLRQAAASVDVAQATALDRYAHAVRQHATEVERVEVDSIVHDGVLTTLLSAARAYTPEAKTLAARMAKNAMGHLRDAAVSSPDDDAPVSLGQLAFRIQNATSTLSAPFDLRGKGVGPGSIPGHSAEAVYSATFQAMVNSLQHAGTGADVRRWLSLDQTDGGGIRVGVGDDGIGFDLDRVDTERLGLRVSIIERVTSTGGVVDIDSEVGRGTVIWITWPSPDPSSFQSVDVNDGATP